MKWNGDGARQWIWVGAAMGVLWGCPAAMVDAEGSPALETVDEAPDEGDVGAASLASAVCGREAECCPGNEDTEADCRASLIRVLEPVFVLPHIAINPAGVARCATLIETMSCSEVAAFAGHPPVLRLCPPFFQGTQILGGECGADDLWSSLYADDQCASTACVDRECVAPAAIGETCQDRPCATGAGCFFGTCHPLGGLGDSCAATGLCAEPGACFAESPGGDLFCQPPETVDVGEPCGPTVECRLGNDQCFCPVGEEGCLWGECGNTSRCYP